jgi:hypothetical protein
MKIPFFGEVHAGSRLLLIAIVFVALSGVYGQEPPSAPEAKNPAAQNELPAKLPDDAAKKQRSRDLRMTSGVVIIESNGEKIRVDTTKKTVEPVAADTADQQRAAAQPAVTKLDEKEPNPYDFGKGEEPYDFRIVNVPTPKHVPKGTWNMTFTHRFTQPIQPIAESAPNLLGLDSFGIASFGMTYGVTDKLYVSAYRSPLCQTGLCKVIELGVGYNWLAHDEKSPIALTTYASIEGNDNFTEEFTYNLQAMISVRTVDKRLYFFFSPAVHINANGQRRFDPRANDFFPPATAADNFRLPTHGASFGFGASFLITPNVVALFDFAPRIGFKLGRTLPIRNSSFQVIGFRHESSPSIGFGIQRNVGKHSFALTFSNTQSTTTSRYNSSNLALDLTHLIIGFNLTRRF